MLFAIFLPAATCRLSGWNSEHQSRPAKLELTISTIAGCLSASNSAARERQHDDEHLREDGECGRSQCNEVPGNNVCNYCATREARKYANYVEVFTGWKSASLDARCS